MVGLMGAGKTSIGRRLAVRIGLPFVDADDEIEVAAGSSIEDIFERLVERERLGCTGLNQGVAFPHCRVEGLDSTIAALIRLSEPVDFDSPDGELVDLVFGLMVPEKINASHQANICSIADLLRDQTLRQKMRDATSSNELYDSLIDSSVATVVIDLKSAQGP
jgi:PTS system nitrogen regulatory IIA component